MPKEKAELLAQLINANDLFSVVLRDHNRDAVFTSEARILADLLG